MLNPSFLRWVLAYVFLFFMIPSTAAGQTGEPQVLLEGNIYNPAFSPSNPSVVAYERQVEDTRELYLYRHAQGGDVRQISAVDESDGSESGEALSDLFGDTGNEEIERFEGQLAWRPVLDPDGRQWFVFSSSASPSGAGLYLSYVAPDGRLADTTIALPFEGQATLPAWSPEGRKLAFTGVRSGESGGEIFLYPDVMSFASSEGGMLPFMKNSSSSTDPVRLTDNPSGNLHPTWSPDGDHIAYQAEQVEDGVRNWGITLLDMTSWAGSGGERPRTVRLTQMLNQYNEYRPSWSPDGERLAFYVPQTRLGRGDADRRQDIAVVSLTTGPRGRVQQGNLQSGMTGKRVVENVVPSEVRGPLWHPTPDSDSRFIIYVKKSPDAGNPIHIADLSRWERRDQNYDRVLSERFQAQTRLHKELTATLMPEDQLGLAFASHAGDNDRLRVETVSGLGAEEQCCEIPQEVSRQGALWRSAAFPGFGQYYKGQRRRALTFAAAGAATLATVVVGEIVHQNKVKDYNNFVDKFGPSAQEDLATAYKGGRLVDSFRKFRSKYQDASSPRIRNIAIVAFAGVWAWNLYDSFQGFPMLSQKPLHVSENFRVEQPRVGLTPGDSPSSLSFSVRIRF